MQIRSGRISDDCPKFCPVISALDVRQFDTEEQRHLSEQLLKSSQGSTVPYIVGLAEYLADVVPIWQRNNAVRSSVSSHQYTLTNSIVPNTEPIVSNSTSDDLSCGSGESLVDTTLSILKMLLLCFIILDLTGDHVTTRSIHHTKFYLTGGRANASEGEDHNFFQIVNSNPNPK